MVTAMSPPLDELSAREIAGKSDFWKKGRLAKLKNERKLQFLSLFNILTLFRRDQVRTRMHVRLCIKGEDNRWRGFSIINQQRDKDDQGAV
jgi:hypothetical protein